MEKEPSDIELELAIMKMKGKKAPGADKVAAEVLKYGGKELRRRVFAVVKKMWRRAVEADEGHEAYDWPEEWKVGITVPLWKKKGDRHNKNTWRGITLLSVSTCVSGRTLEANAGSWGTARVH